MAGDEVATEQAVIDRHGDVWTLGDDNLMHTPETRPCTFAHVEKKFGPLRPALGATGRCRVTFTDGSIQGVVTARKRHRCETHLSPDDRHHIEVGDRYVANALPPGNQDIGNPGWWHMRVCLDCCPIEYDPRTRPGDHT